jgi:hypothetical protein
MGFYKRLVMPEVPLLVTDMIGEPVMHLEQSMWDKNISYYTRSLPKEQDKRIKITFNLKNSLQCGRAKERMLPIYMAMVKCGFVKPQEDVYFLSPEEKIDTRPSTIIDIWLE